MKYLKNLIFIIFFSISINQIINQSSFAESNLNSIIKSFCIKNVKAEMNEANLEYEESFGEEVCNCYLENISNNIDHQRSISLCKFKNNKNNKNNNL